MRTETTTGADEELARRLPFPLAQLYRRGHNAKTALERHQAGYYLWEAGLKLLGSAALVEYSEIGERDPQLLDRLRNLARPSLGHWWEFVRKLLPVLADSGRAPAFTAARDLLLGRARDDLPRAAGLDAALREASGEGVGGRSVTRLCELFDGLVRYRNRELGHGAAGQRREAHYEKMGTALLAGVSEIYGKLDVLLGRRLLHVVGVTRQASGRWLVERFELLGEAPRRVEPLDVAEGEERSLPRPNRVAIEDRARLLSLHPLVLFDPDSSEFFYLNARRGERESEYLSYSTGRIITRATYEDDQRELFQRIFGGPVGPTEVNTWAEQSQMEEPAAEAKGPSGRTLGEFELLSRLGRGGMGVVYRAWQPSLARQVALKCLLASGDPRIDARFAREIRSLGKVEHPNLVKIYTSGSDGDQWYYAMELIEGADLASLATHLATTSAAELGESEWLRALSTACHEARRREESVGGPDRKSAEPPPLPMDGTLEHKASSSHIARAVAVIRQAAEAAHALHEAGVVHRDIKPGNIVLTADGAHAVLMDLGVAQLADEAEGRLTRTRQFVGTLRYASPEQLLAAATLDRRADVYSLGATLYELLTLKPLFGATDETPAPDLMIRIQSAEPERPRRSNPKVPRDLEAIVLKCLEKDRERRYRTARDLAEDLVRWERGEPVLAQPPTLRYVLGKFARRHRAPIAAAAILLLAGLLGTAYAFWRIETSRREALAALFDSATALGIQAGDRGGPGEALLRFAHAASLGVKDESREEANRVRFRGWSREVLSPRRVFFLDGESPRSLDFHPRGAHLLCVTAKSANVPRSRASRAVVWDLEREEAIPLPGGERPVNCAAWSPQGTLLALGTPEGRLEVFRFPEGDPVAGLTQEKGIRSLAWSRDGRLLAFAGERVQIWDSIAGKLRGEDLVHPAAVWKIAFDGKAERLLTACEDRTSRVFSLASAAEGGRDSLTLPGLAGPTADFRPSLPLFLDTDRGVLDQDNRYEANWYDARSGAVTLVLGQDSVDTVLLSASQDPAGLRMALTYSNGVEIWDVRTRRRMAMVPFQGFVHFAAWHPRGDEIAVGGAERAVSILSVRGREPEPLAILPHDFEVACASYSPDGIWLATAQSDGLVRVWDLRRKSPVFWSHRTTSFLGPHPVLSPDGKHVLSVEVSRGNEPRARVFEAQSGKPAGPACGGGPLLGGAFSPRGDEVLLLSAHPRPAWNISMPYKEIKGRVRLWRWRPGAEPRTVIETASLPLDAAYSPDGTRAAVACAAGTIIFLDPSTCAVLRSADQAESRDIAREDWMEPRRLIRFSPTGRLFATFALGDLAQLWDGATGEPRGEPLRHPYVCYDAAFSPDGRFLATASFDNAARVWNVETGTLAGAPLSHSNFLVSAGFSGDGKVLVTSCFDGTAQVWDWRAGKLFRAPFEHASLGGGDAMYLPGGRWLTSVSLGALRVWDPDTGLPVLPELEVLGREIMPSPDGKLALVSGRRAGLSVVDLDDLHEGERPEPSWEDRRAWAEIVSGKRIHSRGGGIQNLTSREWYARWIDFRPVDPLRKAPEFTRESLVSWHREETARAERGGDWSAAEWHLGRLRGLGEEVDLARLSRFGEFVRRWTFSPITKPFPQDDSSARRFPSLAAEDLRRIEELALAALPITFPGPYVDFIVGCPERPSRILAYAVRDVQAETARAVKVLCGSDDTIRIWLNGKLIHSNWILRGADPDKDEARADLAAGRNVLTVEVGQHGGNWGLYLRFEDLSGQKLRLTDEGKLEPID